MSGTPKPVSTVITFVPDLSLNPLWPTPLPCAHCEELTRELAERDRELEDMGVRLDQARALAARLKAEPTRKQVGAPGAIMTDEDSTDFWKEYDLLHEAVETLSDAVRGKIKELQRENERLRERLKAELSPQQGEDLVGS
jgi:hypothetical protein